MAARSLPTAVPESPRNYVSRTPRTPRTPRMQDPTKTPRFYPVVKESRSIDVQVIKSRGLCTSHYDTVPYCQRHSI